MGEGIAIDPTGNLYTAETSPALAGITKYVKRERFEARCRVQPFDTSLNKITCDSLKTVG